MEMAENHRAENLNEVTEKKASWSQWVASITLSLLMMEVGLANGWASPYLAKLTRLENFDGIPKLNDVETSWIASLLNIGRLFGAFAGAISQEVLGRKVALSLAGIPMMGGWICTIFANSVYWLYGARILAGISGGIAWTTVSVYLAEIADPEIRGSIILWNVTMVTVGQVLGNLIAPYVSIPVFGYIALGFNVLFQLAYLWIPESPYYYLINEKHEKAEKALQWFRRKKDVKVELQVIQEHVNDCKVSLYKKLKEMTIPKQRNGVLLIIMLNFFNYFAVFNAMTSYMEIVVRESQVTLITPSTVVTCLGFFSMSTVFLTTYLVDKWGRRILIMFSGAGIALSLTVLSFHFWLLNLQCDSARLTWLPILCLLVYYCSYCFGINSIPSALVGEIFSPRLKCIGSLIFSSTFAISTSISASLFLPIAKHFGWGQSFLFYAIGTYISIAYYYYAIPETKGRTLQDIQKPTT